MIDSLCNFRVFFYLQLAKTPVIVIPLSLEFPNWRTPTMDGRFFDLITEIAERLDHDWTVEEMAAKTGLSVSQFRSVFKQVTLLSPAAYLKDTRLHRANYLLETTYDHIDQIGILVGMRDPSHFTRDFKQRFDLTPTECRRQYQEIRQAELLKLRAELINGHKSEFSPRNSRFRQEIVVDGSQRD